MESTTTTPRQSKLKRLFKFLGFGMVFLLAAVFVGNQLWSMSGSNKWQLVIDKNGTRIYTLKTPGCSVKKIKGVTHYKQPLSHIVAPFLDKDIEKNCSEWAPGCLEYKLVKPFDPQRETNLQVWKFGLFPPFSPREIVLHGEMHQDKQTKEITIENIAAPNSVPLVDGYVRVTHFHNIWHYTPQANGEVEVQFIQDADMGGAFPALLANLGGPQQVYKMLQEDVPKSLNKEKYRHAKFDFIDDVAVKTGQVEKQK